jgi:thiamine-monophosphate kinase
MPLPERALIAQIRRAVGRNVNPQRSIIAGIGDDCAVLAAPAGHDSLVTTDFSLEGIHFRRGWHPPDSVGHRCLARGLSDIAAMGGKPVAAFLSLALPQKLPPGWIEAFTRGLLRLAARHGVTLAGGDTAQSPSGIMADIVVLGTVPHGKAVLRSNAQPGDHIYVSGQLGGSAAAVLTLRGRRKLDEKAYPRHFYPEPRIELGLLLRKKGLCSAMIDTSDGLSTDLSHICEESGVGAEVDSTMIPRARVGKPRREVDLEMALHGGEDYELLFTVPTKRRIPPQIAGVKLTQIGHVTRSRTMLLRDSKGHTRELIPRGWEHFRQ